MKSSTIIAIIVLFIIVIGGVFLLTQSTPQTTVSPTSTAIATQTLTIASSTSMTGSYLEGSNGMTLYTYANDTSGTSTCSDACAAIWPPYTVSSAAGITIDPNATGTVGTITRSGGSLQVTYNGKPLYFYSKDSAPGQANGEGIGGKWSIARP